MAWRRIDVHRAAERGDIAVLERYLKAGGDPERKDSAYGAAPVHWASLRGKVIAVSLLLDKGADVESRTVTDGTPLVWGCMGGDPKVVQLLLERGADINACTTGKGTALHHAATYGHAEVVAILLERGAGAHAEDNRACRPGDRFDHDVPDDVRRAIARTLSKARGENPPLAKRRSSRRISVSGKTHRIATSAASNGRSRQSNGEERNRRSTHNGHSHASGITEGGRNGDQGRNGSVSEGRGGNADSTRMAPAIENRAAAAAAAAAAATESPSPSPPPIGANGFVTVQPHLLSEPSGTPLLTNAAADAAVVVTAETPLRTKDQDPISSKSLPSLRGVGSARPSSNRGDPGGRRQENGCDKSGTIDVVERPPAAAPLGWSLAAMAMRFLGGDANDHAADGTSNSDSECCPPQVDVRGDNHVQAATFASSDGERSSPDNNSTDEGVGPAVDLEVEGLRRQVAVLASAADSAAASDLEGRATMRDVLEEATARAEEAGRAERARSETLNTLVQVLETRLSDRNSQVARLERELEDRDARLREGADEVLSLRKRVEELDHGMSVLRACLDRLPPVEAPGMYNLYLAPDDRGAQQGGGGSSMLSYGRTKSSPSLSARGSVVDITANQRPVEQTVRGDIVSEASTGSTTAIDNDHVDAGFVDVGEGIPGMEGEKIMTPPATTDGVRRRRLLAPATTAAASSMRSLRDRYPDQTRHTTDAGVGASGHDAGDGRRGALDDAGNLSSDQFGGGEARGENAIGRAEAIEWWRHADWRNGQSGSGIGASSNNSKAKNRGPDPAEDHERLSSLYSMIARR